MNFIYVITLLSIIGTLANAYKKRWSFFIYLFTNAFWCIYDLYKGIYAQSILFAVYFVIAVIGIIKWKEEDK